MDTFYKWSRYLIPVAPGIIITRWDNYSTIAVIIFGLASLTAFILSYKCYSDTDETPFGMKILFALLSAFWNVLYLIYYFFTVHVFGLRCGS